jgi:hypothetical protein
MTLNGPESYNSRSQRPERVEFYKPTCMARLLKGFPPNGGFISDASAQTRAKNVVYGLQHSARPKHWHGLKVQWDSAAAAVETKRRQICPSAKVSHLKTYPGCLFARGCKKASERLTRICADARSHERAVPGLNCSWNL